MAAVTISVDGHDGWAESGQVVGSKNDTGKTLEQLSGLGTGWKVIHTEFEVERNTFVICVAETGALWSQEKAARGQAVTCSPADSA